MKEFVKDSLSKSEDLRDLKPQRAITFPITRSDC